jgi:hypothetical protein
MRIAPRFRTAECGLPRRSGGVWLRARLRSFRHSNPEWCRKLKQFPWMAPSFHSAGPAPRQAPAPAEHQATPRPPGQPGNAMGFPQSKGTILLTGFGGKHARIWANCSSSSWEMTHRDGRDARARRNPPRDEDLFIASRQARPVADRKTTLPLPEASPPRDKHCLLLCGIRCAETACADTSRREPASRRAA